MTTLIQSQPIHPTSPFLAEFSIMEWSQPSATTLFHNCGSSKDIIYPPIEVTQVEMCYTVAVPAEIAELLAEYSGVVVCSEEFKRALDADLTKFGLNPDPATKFLIIGHPYHIEAPGNLSSTIRNTLTHQRAKSLGLASSIYRNTRRMSTSLSALGFRLD